MNNSDTQDASPAASLPTPREHNSAEPEWTQAHLDQWLHQSKTYRNRIRREAARPAELGINRNSESWVEFDEFTKWARPYAATFPFDGQYLDAMHREIAEAPVGAMGVSFLIDLGVEGYLSTSEALKLYEMARLCTGDILELGTFKGLSAMIMAGALRARGSACHLTTVDLNPESTAAAASMLEERLLSPWVTLLTADAPIALDEFIAQSLHFGFIFVDHWHGYQATRDAIARLPALMDVGGFVLFHDFNDPSNADPAHAHKVYPAVLDSIAVDDRFEFYGIFGSAVLYRRVG